MKYCKKAPKKVIIPSLTLFLGPVEPHAHKMRQIQNIKKH